MAEDRSWMYTGRRAMGDCTQEWMEKSTDFVDRAFARRNGRGVLCPCSRCSNTRPQTRATMIAHLYKYGFRAGYTVWVYHGESQHSRSDVLREETDDGGHNESRIEDMLDDVRHAYGPPAEEEPEPATRAFFDMLSAASQPLHGHTQVSQLDAITRLLAVKSQFSTSIACFDAFLSVFSTLLPDGHKLPANLYEAKKLISALNMPYEKIDVCPNHCMLFRNENVDKDHCDKCGESRFVEVDSGDGQKRQLPIGRKILRYLPFVPRIQRLYMSEVSAKQMVWHKYGRRYHNDKMVHPSDGEAWKQILRDRWCNERWLQASRAARERRLLMAGTAHRQGSSSMARYKKNLEKKKQRPVSDMEAYLEARRGDQEGTLCSQRATEHLAAYTDAAKEIHGPEYDVMNSPLDASDVYKAGKGKKHGRFSMGAGYISTPTTLSEVRSTSAASTDEVHLQCRQQPPSHVSESRFSQLETRLQEEIEARKRLEQMLMQVLGTGTRPNASPSGEPLTPHLSTPGTAGSVASTANPEDAGAHVEDHVNASIAERSPPEL